ncbi:hypothetical protein SPB21_13770 [Leptothoe sp. ISB3NOV94-8A]
MKFSSCGRLMTDTAIKKQIRQWFVKPKNWHARAFEALHFKVSDAIVFKFDAALGRKNQLNNSATRNKHLKIVW